MKVLLDGVTIDNIPKMIGGEFDLFNEAFQFDTSVGGPLWYDGAPSALGNSQSQDLPSQGISNASGPLDSRHESSRGRSLTSVFASVPAQEPEPPYQPKASDMKKKTSSTENSRLQRYHYLMIVFSVLFFTYTYSYHSDRFIWLGMPFTVAVMFSLLDL